jgi:hypothetical protein
MIQFDLSSGEREILLTSLTNYNPISGGNLIEMGCVEIEGHWIPGNLPKRQVNRSVVFGITRDLTKWFFFHLTKIRVIRLY